MLKKKVRVAAKRKAKPKPSSAEIKALIDFLKEADRLLSLATRGISALRGMPQLVTAIAHYDHGRELPDEAKKEIANAQSYAQLAEAEVKSDFSLLRSHTFVAMWSALEAGVPKICARWLIDQPQYLHKPEFEKIRVPISLYEGQSQEFKMSLIIEEILQAQRTGQGTLGKLEGLMHTVGLNGGLPEKLRRTLYEMSQVRNLLVHQFGVADMRFLKACPWIRNKEGSRFKITRGRYQRYVKAMVMYITEITWRMVIAKGGKRSPQKRKR